MMGVNFNNSSDDALIVSGVRTPFVRSHGLYVNQSSFKLGSAVLSELAHKNLVPMDKIEQICFGTVLHDPKAPNITRECLLGAGYPISVPAYTVSMACISSNIAATNIAASIKNGNIKIGICGGTDTCSDPPIRVSEKLRKSLVQLSKVKKATDISKLIKILKKIKLSDLKLDVPKVVEFSNGKSMGQGAEILSEQSGIVRQESDKFAVRSHKLAAEAYEKKYFEDYIINYKFPPQFQEIIKDDGIRSDSNIEKLSKLSPAFNSKFGVCTAGNSSFLTDGASALLLMNRSSVDAYGMEPMAIIRDFTYQAGDPLNEMLSGPSLSVPILLDKCGLKVEDIDVWEFHEAFASQVLANLKNISNENFIRNRLGINKDFAPIPIEKVNAWGGSLSIGHPFGATGSRLLWTAAKRLKIEKGKFAIVTSCAAGGHGSSILLEKV